METPTATTPSKPVNMRVWVISALVVVGIIIVLMNINKKSDDVAKDSNSDAALEATTLENDSETVSATLVTTTDPDQALRYTVAFQKYAGRRVEFSTRCQMSPKVATFQSGTKIMLDNRGSIANRIIVDDKMFQIPAYNFAFLTLEPGSLPTTHVVGCGSSNNVGSIVITK